MKNCFQSPDGHSEISNDQALLNPFNHYIKMKAYMRVEIVSTPLPQANIDYLHRDEI